MRRPVTSSATSVQLAVPQAAFAGGGGGPTIVRRWLVQDHLGNATLVVSSGGTSVDRRLFDPYGLVLQEESTEATPRLFTGKRYQGAAGLYDFGARWYDPEAGRFASIDPIVQALGDPQTHNAYGYVRNNPITLTDSDGRFFGGDFGGALEFGGGWAFSAWGFLTSTHYSTPNTPVLGVGSSFNVGLALPSSSGAGWEAGFSTSLAPASYVAGVQGDDSGRRSPKHASVGVLAIDEALEALRMPGPLPVKAIAIVLGIVLGIHTVLAGRLGDSEVEERVKEAERETRNEVTDRGEETDERDCAIRSFPSGELG